MRIKLREQKVRPKDGLYYDLIRVPHGHIPAPMTNLWSALPIPVKDERGCDYYYCPNCGEPSFFKINSWCRTCEAWDLVDDEIVRRYKRRRRRKYFKEIFKRIEYWFLPILILLGKAWYVGSTRLKWSYDLCGDKR